MSQSVTPIKKLRKKLGVRPIFFFWGGVRSPLPTPQWLRPCTPAPSDSNAAGRGTDGDGHQQLYAADGRTDGRTPGPPLKASMHRHQARRGRHCCDVSGSGANVDARFRCDHSTTTTTTTTTTTRSSGSSALCRLQWTANDQTNYRAPADVRPPTWFGLHTGWAKTSGATDS